MDTKSARVRLYADCPLCSDHEFRIDHLAIGQPAYWSCDSCGEEIQFIREGLTEFRVAPTGKKRKAPITVTLRSDTVPPIEVKVNTWKYPPLYGEEWTQEEFLDHERFFFEEHTCPTNWLRDVEEITFEGDHDPHGLFKFVSVENGHYKDPSVIY